jgi:hypothetical protein
MKTVVQLYHVYYDGTFHPDPSTGGKPVPIPVGAWHTLEQEQKSWWPSQWKKRMSDFNSLIEWCLKTTSRLLKCSELKAAEWWTAEQKKCGSNALKSFWETKVKKHTSSEAAFLARLKRASDMVSPAKGTAELHADGAVAIQINFGLAVRVVRVEEYAQAGHHANSNAPLPCRLCSCAKSPLYTHRAVPVSYGRRVGGTRQRSTCTEPLHAHANHLAGCGWRGGCEQQQRRRGRRKRLRCWRLGHRRDRGEVYVSRRGVSGVEGG